MESPPSFDETASALGAAEMERTPWKDRIATRLALVSGLAVLLLTTLAMGAVTWKSQNALEAAARQNAATVASLLQQDLRDTVVRGGL